MKESARSALRRATAACHGRVDRVFSVARLDDRDSYRDFLLAQAAAHIPVEEALTQAGTALFLADWPERQRAAQLRADLAALGCTAPASLVSIGFGDEAAMLGGVYVLEGSRLGGTLLKRSVPPDFPSTFLGNSDSAGWRRLLALIEDRLREPEQIERAIVAASDVFRLFEECGERFLKPR